jgi:hypothetical protein
MLKAVARRGTWESAGRREILDRLLQTSLSDGTYKLSEVAELLRIAEDYQPADSSALLARIPGWQRVLEEEVHSTNGPKAYFSSAVQQLHGGNDNRLMDENRMVQKRNELEFLKRLQQILAAK